MRGTTILRRLIAWDLQDWTMPPLVSAFLTQKNVTYRAATKLRESFRIGDKSGFPIDQSLCCGIAWFLMRDRTQCLKQICFY